MENYDNSLEHMKDYAANFLKKIYDRRIEGLGDDFRLGDIEEAFRSDFRSYFFSLKYKGERFGAIIPYMGKIVFDSDASKNKSLCERVSEAFEGMLKADVIPYKTGNEASLVISSVIQDRE